MWRWPNRFLFELADNCCNLLLSVCLLEGLGKNYLTHFYEIFIKGVSCPNPTALRSKVKHKYDHISRGSGLHRWRQHRVPFFTPHELDLKLTECPTQTLTPESGGNMKHEGELLLVGERIGSSSGSIASQPLDWTTSAGRSKSYTNTTVFCLYLHTLIFLCIFCIYWWHIFLGLDIVFLYLLITLWPFKCSCCF